MTPAELDAIEARTGCTNRLTWLNQDQAREAADDATDLAAEVRRLRAALLGVADTVDWLPIGPCWCQDASCASGRTAPACDEARSALGLPEPKK